MLIVFRFGNDNATSSMQLVTFTCFIPERGIQLDFVVLDSINKRFPCETLSVMATNIGNPNGCTLMSKKIMLLQIRSTMVNDTYSSDIQLIVHYAYTISKLMLYMTFASHAWHLRNVSKPLPFDDQ